MVSERVWPGQPASTLKCAQCGFENPSNVRFCGNCGAKLEIGAYSSGLQGLALLMMTGGAYLLVSLLLNALVQSTLVFFIPYLASSLLGLYTGYQFYTGRTSRLLKRLSALAIVLALFSTGLLFLIGLGVRGVIGPVWIIFAVAGYLLWKNWGNQHSSTKV